jgi:hypothetical protein
LTDAEKEEAANLIERIKIAQKKRAAKPTLQELLKRSEENEAKLKDLEEKTLARGYKLEGGKLVPLFDVSQLVNDEMIKRCEEV